MRRKLAVVFVVLFVVSLVTVAPVSAERPLRGPLDTHFNLGFMDEDTPCPLITWAGTVELGSEEYGLAWTPLGPLVERGQTLRIEERWLIYSEPFTFAGGGVFTECEGADLVMWGDEKAVESIRNLHVVGNGKVVGVASDGPFDEGLVGRNSHWSGVISDDLLHTPGTFRINR